MRLKVLAAAPHSPLAKCMIDHIVVNVRERAANVAGGEGGALQLSGPGLLHRCFEVRR
jgi:hypothetical protein